MIYFGLVLVSITEFFERFISLGGFYLSPGRIYILALAYCIVVLLVHKSETFRLGPTAKSYAVIVGLLLGVIGVSVLMSEDLIYSLKRVLNASSLLVLPL